VTPPHAVCAEPGCPTFAVDRGRCGKHRRTTAQLGYGTAWQRLSRAVRAEVGHCQRCGTTADLTTDHRVPRSLGGDDRRAGLRVLCRSCHGAIGVRSDRQGMGVKSLRVGRQRLSFQRSFPSVHDPENDGPSLVVVG
jgi:hypothetical protein